MEGEMACTTLLARAGLIALLLVSPAAAQPPAWFGAPTGFILPALHPAGARLETRELAPGVYALLSTKPPVDNSGFVVGERGVLVIDGHINGQMARQIQDAVRAVTSKPILYVVNTNYHGDHTFGNYAFPAETLIVAHRETAERMRDFQHEKEFVLAAVANDASVLDGVRPRLPDVVFDDYLRLDLGGRVAEIHHFGPGNTPGDTVVYAPDAKAAWTGNLVVGAGSIPPLFEAGAGAYLETIARFARTLDVETVVPGHGQITSGEILGRYATYLSELLYAVRRSIQAGHSLEETLAGTPLGERYAPPANSPLERLRPFLAGLHRLNIQRTYRELGG
jgi:cyclase